METASQILDKLDVLLGFAEPTVDAAALKARNERLKRMLSGEEPVDDETIEALRYTAALIAGDNEEFAESLKNDVTKMIKFRPVSDMCIKERKKRSLSIKQAALAIKVQQYSLTNIETPHVRQIRLKDLDKYLDFLGLRDKFDEWKQKNTWFYESLGKAKG